MSNPKQGLMNNARSPGSIANAQHHDPSGSERDLSGMPGTMKKVLTNSTTKEVLEPFAILWVVNRDAAPQYIYVGKDSAAPAVVDASNGMCIPAGWPQLIYCGASDDDKESIVVKTSSAQIHVTIIES